MKSSAKKTPDTNVAAPVVAAPAAAAATKPVPVLNIKDAKAVTAFRHEKTAKTVGFVQVDGLDVHLFSATGSFIDTVSTAEIEPTPDAAAETKTDAPADPSA